MGNEEDITPIAEACDQDEAATATSSASKYFGTPWWLLQIKRKLILKSQTPLENGEGVEGKDEEPERGYWANEAEFLLSLLGLAVGLGNVWRFPWMCWKNGGGAFLIPYTIMLLLCGIPLFLMELTLGQYAGAGPGNIFQIAPLFKGLGWCVLCNSFFGSAYYITVITWAFYYFFSSFTSELPWIGCQQPWNSDRCYSVDEQIHCSLATNNTHVYYKRQCLLNSTSLWENVTSLSDNFKVPATDEYFNRKMYNIFYEDGEQRPMEATGPPKWDLTLTLIFAWIVTYLCVIKGIKSSGKVVYFTATFPYLVLLALTIVGAQLEGADEGIKFYLEPKWEKLKEPMVWADAAAQIFYSLGLAGGSVMTYASYNRYNNNILRDCLIVGFSNSLTSLLAGFPIFCALGYMAQRMHKPIDQVITSGSGLAFIAYPEVVATIPGAPFWSAMFFFMLITLGLDSQFGGLETMMTAVCDKKPQLMHKKWAVAGVISLALFVIGLSTVAMAGAYWQELLNYYSGWSIIFVAFFNVIVYGWMYGAGKIIDHLQHMLKMKFPRIVVWILLIAWKFIAPGAIIGIMIASWTHVRKIDYHDYQLPDWAQAFGWLIASVPLTLVPIGAVYTFRNDVKNNPYSAEAWYQRTWRLTNPTDKWLPSYLKHAKSIATVTGNCLTHTGNVYGTGTILSYGSADSHQADNDRYIDSVDDRSIVTSKEGGTSTSKPQHVDLPSMNI